MNYQPYYSDGMGSWLSKAFRSTVGYVVGKGNTPGTPETRKYGYSPTEVAAAVANNIATGGSVSPTTEAINPQGKMLLLGAAGVATLLLLSGGKRGRKF